MMTLQEAKARCWAEIDFDALKSNYLEALSLLSNGAGIICVLKANAYGLGAIETAKELYTLGARRFAVACMAEAEELKTAVNDIDVLVLGLVDETEAARAIQKGISLTAWNEAAVRIIKAAAHKVQTPARVHIKLDTGLHRLGFSEDEFEELPFLFSDDFIKVEGLYTHLALRDKEHDIRQFELFDRADAILRAHGYKNYLRHACDSIGMVRYPERHMDAVRLGAWLYGVCPNRYEHPERDKLTLRLMTRVSDVHTVAAGECIGYDDEHPLESEKHVATLSAGYVDGYPRLNNAGEVLIRGKRAGVLGLVCMDQMMVDVSDIPSCTVGDEVTLLGGGIGLNEYAQIAHMNRNECLSRTGRRVPRIYTKNGKVYLIKRDI